LVSADDRLVWEIDEAASACVEKMPDLERDAFYYSSRELVRNAIVHGRSPGKDLEVCITAGFDQKAIWLKVKDNGPGFSGRKMDGGETYPGTGQGLELHKTILELLGGSIQVIPEADGFSVLMKLPSPANKHSERFSLRD
jgi:signal transduction histidine kinase